MYQEINEKKEYEEFEKLLLETIAIYKLVENKSYPAIEIFIGERVWESNVNYNRMIIKTKEKFFESQYKRIPLKEYEEGIRKLWNSIDHTYMDKAIKELQQMVIQEDFNNAKMYGNKKITEHSIKLQNSWRDFKLTDSDLYKLHSEYDYKTLEDRYVNRHVKLYKNILNRYKNSNNLSRDLTNFMKKYDDLDKTIPYFSHRTGEIIRYVDISTYNSMLYNVDLTRSAWNRSIYDAKLLGNHLWYLPAHPYACPCCMEYQGKVYADKDGLGYPLMETAIDGGVGHPNCKHVWVSYWDEEQIQEEKYDNPEWEEKYKTKQKIQSIDLKKSRLLADRRIYKNLGSQDLVDKTTAKIKQLREKKKELELKL